ncbi:cytochrome C oxidase subunit IV family protein [Methylobacterium nodulans]|uniref:Caa(3)-type oxidase, subunit IV n=1 Tax=Methylobacterium nodulans (strain LMG 21967 / CNCM I-2342 / ORS 2060) TaxID=460265 RepID=B8IHG5_METNO|nr:cytochrome C oxidase subunit IV family protein [Methylobacterium nodulans]ACL61628.1 caa(3)-type oxidase, subunit IV [Methylobacterium nodulans ORS 2060]
MSPTIRSLWLRNLAVWAALLGLLTLSYFAAFWKLGSLTTAIGFGIAAVKALLVLVFYMELKEARGLVRLAAAAGFIWAGVLFALTLSDVLTRS